MGGNNLTLEDLPPTIQIEDDNVTETLSNKLEELSIEEKEIAEKIYEICTYRNIGRRDLTKILVEQGYKISEYKLRTMLSYLKEKDLIYFGKGRCGIKLSNFNL